MTRVHSAAIDHHFEDAELLDDPAALAEAERAVRDGDARPTQDEAFEEWVCVFGPAKISGFYDNPGAAGFIFSAPLAEADIPFRWEPYAPELMPCYRPGDGVVDRPFAIAVPEQFAEQAAAALNTLGVRSTAWSQFSLPLQPVRTAQASEHPMLRRLFATAIFVLPFIAGYLAIVILRLLRR